MRLKIRENLQQPGSTQNLLVLILKKSVVSNMKIWITKLNLHYNKRVWFFCFFVIDQLELFL